ncbi:MAG: glycosyltransferase family 1 protein [Candidatus Latescibacterota bacterium]
MRIGVDIRELERGARTGIGRYLRNFLAHGSRAHPEHSFLLYANQRTDPQVEGRSLQVRVRREGVTLWWDQVVLAGLARADRLDVFLSPYPKGPLRLPCPLVVTIHDLTPLVLPQQGSWRTPVRRTLFRLLAQWVGRRAARIITDSEHSARDIVRLLHVDPSRIRVLPIGVEPRFRPLQDAAQLRQVLARYQVEPPYLLWVGNGKPHKNVPGLLRAFARLQQRDGAGPVLVLAGDLGRWGDGHRLLARQLGLEERVRFTGPVAEDDLPALYAGAGLFVFPSLYEGFGLPPLEAMACGTPVVASSRTSLPEVVGDAGLLVDPLDEGALAAALGRLLADGAEHQRLRRAGLERARRFRPDRIGEEHLAILQEAAACPR